MTRTHLVLLAFAVLLPGAALADHWPYPDIDVKALALLVGPDPGAGTFAYVGDCNGGGVVTLMLGDFRSQQFPVRSIMEPDCGTFLPAHPVQWRLLRDGDLFVEGGGDLHSVWTLHGAHEGGTLVVVEQPLV